MRTLQAVMLDVDDILPEEREWWPRGDVAGAWMERTIGPGATWKLVVAQVIGVILPSDEQKLVIVWDDDLT